MTYYFEIADFRLIDHEKLVASMTLVINGVIEIQNCSLIYSPKSKKYRLAMPSKAYENPETRRTYYYSQARLSPVLLGKALAAAVEMYEDMKD